MNRFLLKQKEQGLVSFPNHIYRIMGFYQLIKKQKLQTTKEELWDFISSPKNLKEITPSYMGFQITTSHLPEKMYEGMIISYKVSPLLGLKMTWVTEITHIRDFEYFVDEQRVGPYSLWHHQHHLEQYEDGVLMTDIITYRPPMGWLGNLANTLFIQKQLVDIFEYRKEVLDGKFNKQIEVPIHT